MNFKAYWHYKRETVSKTETQTQKQCYSSLAKANELYVGFMLRHHRHGSVCM